MNNRPGFVLNDLRRALQKLQAWDCLNPPRVDMCADLAWVKQTIDEALKRSETCICPSCVGFGNHGDLPCFMCGGDGEIPIIQLEWISRGYVMKAWRIQAGLGIRSAAERAGLQASDILKLEKGLLDNSQWETLLKVKECDHEIVEDDIGSAVCRKCGEYFGWYCPNSKTHLCEYTIDEDCCDHCGNPEERK